MEIGFKGIKLMHSLATQDSEIVPKNIHGMISNVAQEEIIRELPNYFLNTALRHRKTSSLMQMVEFLQMSEATYYGLMITYT